MDIVVSRMMRLLGVLNVLGLVVGGIYCANLKAWPSAIFYLVYGVISAVIFTVIWTCASSSMAKLLGHKTREDYTKTSSIGMSVGVLALFNCVGFMCAGLAATWGGNTFYALCFHVLGSLTTAILALIWCNSEYNYVSAAKG